MLVIYRCIRGYSELLHIFSYHTLYDNNSLSNYEQLILLIPTLQSQISYRKYNDMLYSYYKVDIGKISTDTTANKK